MTLEEAIKHAEEVAEEKFNNAVYIMDKSKSDIALENAEECKRCAEEHRQLAEWLKDYKRLLEQEPMLDKIRAEIKEIIKLYEGSCDQDLGVKWGFEGALEIIDEKVKEHET